MKSDDISCRVDKSCKVWNLSSCVVRVTDIVSSNASARMYNDDNDNDNDNENNNNNNNNNTVNLTSIIL